MLFSHTFEGTHRESNNNDPHETKKKVWKKKTHIKTEETQTYTLNSPSELAFRPPK